MWALFRWFWSKLPAREKNPEPLWDGRMGFLVKVREGETEYRWHGLNDKAVKFGNDVEAVLGCRLVARDVPQVSFVMSSESRTGYGIEPMKPSHRMVNFTKPIRPTDLKNGCIDVQFSYMGVSGVLRLSFAVNSSVSTKGRQAAQKN